MLRVHDTAKGEVTELSPRDPGAVSMYVCGPTVYDHPHVGHGRFTLVWDVLRRYLEWTGLSVRFVSNVTDIDDKIIDRANAEGRGADEVAAEYEAVWFGAMDRLGVRRPDADPHATAFVERMVELIGELERAGFAYDAPDSVYFAVEQLDGYGLLARQPLESLRAGARVEAGEGKRSPLDFALWKKAKPGEPSWPSPWGDGRPGWHTECVVMSLDILGDGFDLHGGGIELAFPHHENERAQAVALGRAFSRHWVHSGHVVAAGGEKMSKSLHNFVTLTELLERVDPRAFRLLVLQAHYRSPVEVTDDTLASATTALARLDEFARAFPPPVEVGADRASLDRFRAAMDDDLDTPAAMALLFELVRRANASGELGAAAAAHEIAAAVGLALGGGDEALDPETAALVAARDDARRQRDFAQADALRDQLVARGWVVKDTPEGTRVHR